MRGRWATSLGWALTLVTVGGGAARAQDWQPAVTLGPPEPAVTLGRPVAVPAPADVSLLPASYAPAPPEAPRTIIRAQMPDPGGPTLLPPPPPAPVGPAAPPAPLPPPPPGGVPAVPGDPYNCGVVNEPPNAGWWAKTKGFCGNLFGDVSRCKFQSDHCFDEMASPVSNPFLFEDPRSLTELRPVFIHQQTPTKNPIWAGGDIEYAGVEGRLALTQRLSVVFSELGEIWSEPHHAGGEFEPHAGFAELRVGPKYTFYRCESSKTVAAAGVNFDIPVGSKEVQQDTGTLSIEPYVSVAQSFLRSSYGTFNVMDTIGYSVATDSERTDFLFNSIHLDYDVANIHKIYPLIEINYFYYAAAGKARSDTEGFEGRDLFNFGSMGVSGNNSVSMAAGARYKYREWLQTGLVYEFPISGHHDLLDWRITFDVIFRY